MAPAKNVFWNGLLRIKRSKENGQSLLKQGSPVFIFMGRARLDLMVLLPSFEMMWEDLDDGYQIFYTYVKNRYLLFKTAPNCYTQKLLSEHKKNPQPKMTMLTLKRVKEIFPYMEDIEYKVGIE